jgi:hypothetical protein
MPMFRVQADSNLVATREVADAHGSLRRLLA